VIAAKQQVLEISVPKRSPARSRDSCKLESEKHVKGTGRNTYLTCNLKK
jgi:hypothetical protein